jgi:recombination protein RecT
MTDTAIVPRQDALVIMRQYLEERRSEIQAAITSDIPAQRMIDQFITAVNISPDLLECTRRSLFLALLRAAREGLLPDGVESAIVKFGKNAQFIKMYSGLLRQFRRSGQFKWFKADVVRDGDEFDAWVDERGDHFLHRTKNNWSAPITKAYAAAITKDDGFFVTVMTIDELNKHKAKSRATRDDAPWKEWFEEMAKKTAIIRLAKVLPSARDVLGDEERLEDEGGAPDAEAAAPRERTPAATLARIAESESSSAPSNAVDETTAASAGPADAAADAGAGASIAPEEQGDKANPDADPDPEALAYERGKASKARGYSRKAIPPEYRDSARSREALAWYAGHDGSAMPAKPAQQESTEP